MNVQNGDSVEVQKSSATLDITLDKDKTYFGVVQLSQIALKQNKNRKRKNKDWTVFLKLNYMDQILKILRLYPLFIFDLFIWETWLAEYALIILTFTSSIWSCVFIFVTIELNFNFIWLKMTKNTATVFLPEFVFNIRIYFFLIGRKIVNSMFCRIKR